MFRAISDRASDGTVDVEVFAMSNQDGTPNDEAIAAFLEKYPERIPQLAQMAEDSTLATERAGGGRDPGLQASPLDRSPRRARLPRPGAIASDMLSR